MKKVVLSLILVLSVLLVAGCAKQIDFSKTNHIICKKSEEKTNDITNTVMTFSYDDNEKIKDFQVEADITYKTPQSKEAIELTVKTLNLITKPLGLFAKTKVNDNGFYFSFSGNIDRYKVLMKNLDGNYNETNINGDTKSEALSSLTKDGFSCEDVKKK